MKKLILFMTISLSVSAGGLLFADPYAHKLEMTYGRVPDRDSVSIPPYPEAVILETSDSAGMQIDGKNMLSSIKLLTSDDIDRVVAWYKQNLSSFYYQKQSIYGVHEHFFWKEKGDYKITDIEARMFNVHVVISDGAMNKDNYPKARAQIEVNYHAK